VVSLYFLRWAWIFPIRMSGFQDWFEKINSK